MTIPERPPDLKKIIRRLETLIGDPRLFGRIFVALLLDFKEVNPAPEGRYRHWETVRRIAPPERLTSDAWWLGIKLARLQMSHSIPLKDKNGRAFQYTLPDPLLEMLHRVDREMSGQIASPEPVANPQTRDRYIQHALLEEAFASSTLAGAISTREDAKEITRTRRRPANGSEQMILNTFRAMQLVSAMKGEKLTPELIFQIHHTITEGTLDDAARVFRQPGDEIGVYDTTNTLLLHSPPPAEEITERMKIMCRFANEGNPDGFLHPVLRAITLHFWLAYDHPFVEGNGRTARALFYWSMLAQGFRLMDCVSISTILRKAPARYRKSFLYTETDDNDLTYFLLAQLRAICRALDDFHGYVEQSAGALRQTTELVEQSDEFNHRQLALLSHALRHPTQRYTIESHRRSHQVTYQTARTDLLGLAKKQLFDKHKQSRAFVFVPAPNLAERLETLG